MSNEKKTENYLTIKNILLGIVFLTVLAIVSGWVDAGFELSYFSNWKMPLILGIIGALMGLVICPMLLGSFSERDNLSKSSLRNGLITINVLIIGNIFAMLVKHEQFAGITFFLVICDLVILYFVFKFKKYFH